MSEQQTNKAVARRFYEEVLNQRRVHVLDDIAAEDYVEHDPFPGQGNGRADLKARVQLLQSAFNPLEFTIEDLISEGDKVVVRWKNAGNNSGSFLGMPPTNKDISIDGIDIYLVREGRLTEHWHVVDQLAQMQQMGLVPAPDGGLAST